MQKKDYRVRPVNVRTTQDIGFWEEVNKNILAQLGKNEAALVYKRLIILENEKLEDKSIITVKNPRKDKIDYVSRLSEEIEKELLCKLKEEYDLKQGQLRKIVKKYKGQLKELENEFNQINKKKEGEAFKKAKEKLMEKITTKVIYEEQLNKWMTTFEKHYEGLIECLCIEDNSQIPVEIKKEIENKLDVLLTYFDEFIN